MSFRDYTGAARSTRGSSPIGFLLLVAVLGAGGLWTHTENEREERAAAQREARLAALDRQLIWVGEVIDHQDDMIVVDYRGREPAAIRLARVAPLKECASIHNNADQYTRAIIAATPVGSTVAVVRSRERDGRFRTPEEHKGFVHPTTRDGRANLNGKSLNEKLVAAGRARPNPEPPLDLAARTALLDRLKASYSARDFAYWSQFARMHRTARMQETGPVGECVRRDRRLQAEEDKRRREEQREEERNLRARVKRDREHRQWVLGPDGRSGTRDDYSYPGEHGGSSGGGSYDVPGFLCPTRWC